MRAVGTYRQLLCHSCSRQWGQVVYQYSEDWTGSRDPLTCTCSTPHVEILPRPGTANAAQCRSAQRAVYYQLPDGTVAAMETNSYMDPGALAAVARGGVRHEIASVHEMRRLHREWQSGDYDPSASGFSGWGQNRNLVMDFDQPSIRSGSANHPLRREVNESLGPQHNPFVSHDSPTGGSTMHIIPGGDVYERAAEDHRRRTRG